MSRPSIIDDFEALVVAEADALGIKLAENRDEWRRYSAATMRTLADAVEEPGFDEALRAAADNVTLKAAQGAVDSADALDERLKALVKGALGMAARAILPR